MKHVFKKGCALLLASAMTAAAMGCGSSPADESSVPAAESAAAAEESAEETAATRGGETAENTTEETDAAAAEAMAYAAEHPAASLPAPISEYQVLADAWNEETGSLAEDLTAFGLSGFTDLAAGDLSYCGVEAAVTDGTVSLRTDGRSVSHGNIYTDTVLIPLEGDIHAGDAVVVRFKARNTGETPLNFLADLYGEGDQGRDTWLARNPIFEPGSDFEECWFYGYATKNTDSACFELTLGYDAQKMEIDAVSAAKYDGPVKESLLLALPGRERATDAGNSWYHFADSLDSWRTTAEDMIEANRKGQLVVRVEDEDGNPAANVTVQATQTGRDYYIGTSSRASVYAASEEGRDESVSRYRDYFNIITFANDLKWEQTAGVSESTKEALAYLKDQGLAVHGHVLFWPSTSEDPYDDGVATAAEFQTVPDYVRYYAKVIAAMQKMQEPNNNYGMGDGTMGTLRTAIERAKEAFAAPYGERYSLDSITDEVTLSAIERMKEKTEQLSKSVEGLADDETSLSGVTPTVEEFQELLREVITEHVSHYASFYTGDDSAITEWDVFNEIFDFSNRGIINALGEDAGSFDGTSMAADGGGYDNQILVDILNAAREAAGDDVALSYNDTMWQAQAAQRVWTRKLFDWLKNEKNAPIDYLGLQAYFRPDNVDSLIDPKTTWEEYDKLLELGIGTEVTEYSLQNFGSGVAADNLRADFNNDYILINYAHPGSRGFISWGGLTMDGPVASAYYRLMYQRLWTNRQTATDAKGTAVFDAFLGDYVIAVTDADGNVYAQAVFHSAANADGTETEVVFTVKKGGDAADAPAAEAADETEDGPTAAEKSDKSKDASEKTAEELKDAENPSAAAAGTALKEGYTPSSEPSVCLMLKEEPEDESPRQEHTFALYADGYVSTVRDGETSGQLRYDAMTGIYTLAGGARLTEPDFDGDQWTYTDEAGSVTLIAYSDQKDQEGMLTGSANVAVGGGITIPIVFEMYLYTDGTFELINNRTESVFDGTWTYAQDGSLELTSQVLEIHSHELSGGVHTIKATSSITAGEQVYTFDLALQGDAWK